MDTMDVFPLSFFLSKATQMTSLMVAYLHPAERRPAACNQAVIDWLVYLLHVDPHRIFNFLSFGDRACHRAALKGDTKN